MPYDGASVSAIETQINKLAPDVILSHWPHDIHQDHRATAMPMLAAAQRHNKILMYEPFMPSGRSYEGFRAQAYFQFDQKAQTNKNMALNSHKSERGKLGGDKWVKAIESRAVVRGHEVGLDFTECLEVLRWDLTF
jgi:N-acetylglucosamine malate deacetylase 1